ncbi:hypothetical protein HPB50_003576 [Hyalomma asiaticum]|uniref:Uncharacterized protein n=1 Tax=Hyalomma asiaticum TaxID=266040 RepID=A0ACB7SRV9_HYAAI|nr:hypothetical protein HPB50_003576 [Hyalomma asiaticum]
MSRTEWALLHRWWMSRLARLHHHHHEGGVTRQQQRQFDGRSGVDGGKPRFSCHGGRRVAGTTPFTPQPHRCGRWRYRAAKLVYCADSSGK